MKPAKPQTKKKPMPKHIHLYGAQLCCKIACDALDGANVPHDVDPRDFALFNLCHAINKIAKHLEQHTP